MTDSFAHLHVHTEFSMLDGAARVNDIAKKAAEDGQPACGVTDHGNMYGVFPFYKACKKAGVKPIIGCELYMVADRNARPKRGRKKVAMDDGGGDAEGGTKNYYHLTVLAENQVGYRNLIKLSSRAFLEGFHYKPRVDWELLEEHKEGLIVTTGCLGGMVLQELMNRTYQDGLAIASDLKDIFGPEHLFVEVQDHGIPEQISTNPLLTDISRDLDLPLVATNDFHYVEQGDQHAHDALLCVQTGALLADKNRFKFHGDQHYLKTAEEMRHVFRAERFKGACDNTLWIAERANVEIEDSSFKLPKFPLPDGEMSEPEYLAKLVGEGAKKRWGDKLTEEQTERLAFELSVIEDMGFSNYFLIVWDLIRYARECGVRPGPGRGSAAGCAVAYCLGITDLDPIKYDLLFERFLNPSRISMPDIDMDIETRFRDEWIRYARDKYGDDRVCQIITFSEIKAKAAVRDAARVLGHEYLVGDRISKAIPEPIMGRSTPISACLVKTKGNEPGFGAAAPLRAMYAEDSQAKEVIDLALGLEGLKRQDGIHAAAVVIADRPLTDILPIQRKPDKKTDDPPVVTQYEMHTVEDLGLLKMDFLGLRNLDVITDCVNMVREIHGVEVPIDHPDIDMEDEATFDLLQKAQTIGVFQLESPQTRDLILRLKPTSFDDVAALVALYRPGPMAANMHNDYADRKNGRQEVSLLHEDAAELLAPTQGLMIYQEQMMRVSQQFAGYSLAEADNLRKACGKKIRDIMAKEKSKFIDGAVATGYPRKIGEEWFAQIEPFADYSFNRSHAYSYGYIAYQTAYLKAHWPNEYMAAVLTSVADTHEEARKYLAECRRMGLKVVPPDINKSYPEFRVFEDEDGWKISYGLLAVRGLGSGVIDLILAARADLPFADFYDFCRRVSKETLNKKAVDSLIKAGAFERMGHPRKGLSEVHEAIIDGMVKDKKKEMFGQDNLFSTLEGDDVFDDRKLPIPDHEYEERTKLHHEREMLGLYVSSHPLIGNEGRVARHITNPVEDMEMLPDQSYVVLGGIISELKKKWTKKGDLMAVFQLEDLQSTVETIVFPKTMESYGHVLANDEVVIVEGKVDRRDERPKLIAMEIRVIKIDGPIDIVAFDDVLDHIKALIAAHPGGSEVTLKFINRSVKLPDENAVEVSEGFEAQLRKLVGPGA